MALCAASSAHGQTIGDYSRAQRELIEATISQASARTAALAAASAASSASASSPPAAFPGARVVTPLVQPPGPVVGVNGVFASSSRAVAEVVVDGLAWLLAAGQPVPGTSWRVDVVAADRVVLTRRAVPGPGPVDARESAVRVFALPAPR